MNNYYFIHIRKTAGTSMREFLRCNFDDGDICPELSQLELIGKRKNENIKEYLRNYRLICGHYYNIRKYIVEPRITFTILRDPISRTISEINQINNDPRDPLHKLIKTTPIEKIFDHHRFNSAIQNSQTRFLVSNAGRAYEDHTENENLNFALKYLRSLDFVGLTESFETSLVLMAQKFGWKMPEKIPRANTKITESGYKKHNNTGLIQKLYKHNKLDILIYQEAQKIFDTNVANIIRKTV